MDGNDDIVTPFEVMLNDGRNNFVTAHNYTFPSSLRVGTYEKYTGFSVADLNKDGFDDLVVVGYDSWDPAQSSSKVFVFLNAGVPPTPLPSLRPPVATPTPHTHPEECGVITHQYNCSTRLGGSQMAISNPSDCEIWCADQVPRGSGCCEWQKDENRCYYVPGASLTPSDQWRFAAHCTLTGLPPCPTGTTTPFTAPCLCAGTTVTTECLAGQYCWASNCVSPCPTSDTTPLAARCQCTAGSITNECLTGQFCLADNTCSDLAEGGSLCATSDTAPLTASCQCAANSITNECLTGQF
eukprot:190271_1